MSNSIPAQGPMTIPTAVPSNNSVVIPQITIPNPFAGFQPNNVQPPVVQGPQLNRVSGSDGAKQFQTVPNAMYALFEDDDDIFYIKTTDKNNYPTLKRFRFFPEDEPEPAPPPEYVTKNEYITLQEQYKALQQSFEDMQTEIQSLKGIKEDNNNGKQYLRSKNNWNGKPNDAAKPSSPADAGTGQSGT